MSLDRRGLLGLRGSFAPDPSRERSVLVIVFLRGGMDGLHTVPAYADPNYRSQRPKIAIPEPGEKDGALDLDGFFGLHPELAPLLDLYRDRSLAVVHACGGPDRSLSHFEAQRNMELGVEEGADIPSGWLTRTLQADRTHSGAPLTALAMGERLPDSLFGGARALVLPGLEDFRLKLPEAWPEGFGAALAALYERGSDEISRAGQRTQDLMRTLARLAQAPPRPAAGAEYPDSIFGRQLRELAAVIRADLGLRIAQLDLAGWDSHVDQHALLLGLMHDLGRGLSAFCTDLGTAMQRVTVVALSEFGRRVAGVRGMGTDHGRGGACFVLGQGIQGGRVHGSWPGLDREQLDRDGNLAVTTDYRDVLGEVLRGRLGIAAHASVFPGHTHAPVRLV